MTHAISISRDRIALTSPELYTYLRSGRIQNKMIWRFH
jgi:hypothetical protein